MDIHFFGTSCIVKRHTIVTKLRNGEGRHTIVTKLRNGEGRHTIVTKLRLIILVSHETANLHFYLKLCRLPLQ